MGAFKMSSSLEQILGCGVLDGTRCKNALPRGVGVPLAENQHAPGVLNDPTDHSMNQSAENITPPRARYTVDSTRQRRFPLGMFLGM
jgi:hypothetical protein